jgi:hypothetical protein
LINDKIICAEIKVFPAPGGPCTNRYDEFKFLTVFLASSIKSFFSSKIASPFLTFKTSGKLFSRISKPHLNLNLFESAYSFKKTFNASLIASVPGDPPGLKVNISGGIPLLFETISTKFPSSSSSVITPTDP